MPQRRVCSNAIISPRELLAFQSANEGLGIVFPISEQFGAALHGANELAIRHCESADAYWRQEVIAPVDHVIIRS